MTRHNLPLDPNSSNNRVPAIARAREIAAHIVPPKILFDTWPRTKSVRDTYAAIVASDKAELNQPTYFELACIAGVSRASVVAAVGNLEAAGLIAKTQAEGVGRGIRYDYATLPVVSVIDPEAREQ